MISKVNEIINIFPNSAQRVAFGIVSYFPMTPITMIQKTSRLCNCLFKTKVKHWKINPTWLTCGRRGGGRMLNRLRFETMKTHHYKH